MKQKNYSSTPHSYEGHYNDVGNRYDRLYDRLFGKSRVELARYIAKNILGRDTADKTVVDIGGGTGATIELLKELTGAAHTFILVEPFQSMHEQAMLRKNKPDALIKATAEDYIARTEANSIDFFLCQEMIHHVNNLEGFFRGAYHALKAGGCLLIVTRPADVDFPFGSHAKRAWKASYSDPPDALPRLFEKVGFNISQEVFSFSITIEKAAWMDMNSSLPIFSHFAQLSPSQIREDLDEMQALQNDPIRFNDQKLYITGKKMPNVPNE